MQTMVPPIDWLAAQEAVRGAAARVTPMLRAVRHPEAPALGPWTVRDVAAHISHAMDTVAAMAKGGGGILPDVWGLSTLTGAMVQGEGEQDLVRLADRIDASGAAFLTFMRDAGSDTQQPWIVRGVEFSLSNLTCHVLNELTVHGRDIALAEGVKWPIPRADAALIVDGFLFPSLAGLGGSMLNQETAAHVRATYDIHVRGGGRHLLRLDRGDLFVEAPGSGPVDCHLSVDPAAFLLVAWDRISQWRAIPRGQLLAWGRRPWLGLKLRTYMRNP